MLQLKIGFIDPIVGSCLKFNNVKVIWLLFLVIHHRALEIWNLWLIDVWFSINSPTCSEACYYL